MNAPVVAAAEAGLPAGTQALVDAIMAFIDQPGCTDAAFDALALRVFAHQYDNDAPFRRFCQGRGATLRTVRSWRDIPAVPISAFKEVTLSCAPVESCARVFMTSGTTRAEQRGRHHHPALDVYDRSMTRNFAARFIAIDDATGGPRPATAADGGTSGTARATPAARLPMAILFPSEDEMPNSSLAHYLSLAVAHFGAGRHFMGAGGIDLDAFRRWLTAACDAGAPCAVLGATYSFVHVLDALAARDERYPLPPGSRLLDTGGYKRQSRELAPDDFYDALSATFGVPRRRCINMYGMTELSTQFYDDGNARVPSVKSGPHWIRSRAIDPLTGRDVPRGDRGVLVHCDLANFNSTTTILTEDVGRMVDGGFELLGRVEGAAAKGCSLAVEAFLGAVRDRPSAAAPEPR